MKPIYSYNQVKAIINNCVNTKDQGTLKTLIELIIEEKDNYTEMEINTILKLCENAVCKI